MQILKIENDKAYFIDKDDTYQEIDKITKDDLLFIANKIIDDAHIKLCDPEIKSLKNQAHSVIYNNLILKFNSLIDRRNEFSDEINQAYKEEYEKYKIHE